MMQQLSGEIVQWGLRRLYHEFAWSYDLVAALVSRGYWPRWIVACLPLLAPGPTLELGCGTGYLQRALSLRGLPHAGLDRSAAMLRWARSKIVISARSPQLVCGDATSLPVGNHTFSNVVATFPAPYILDARTLSEVKRVLRPGGQFLIVDSGLLTTPDTYTASVDLAYRAILQHGRPDPRPSILRAAGFSVDEQWIDVDQSRVWLLRGRPL